MIEAIAALGANKILIGIAMLMVNMGSRIIIQDLTSFHNKILSHIVVKQIIIFCIFFTATRDIYISIIMTFLVSVIIYYLLNENSDFCIMHSSILSKKSIDKLSMYLSYFDKKTDGK